MSLPLRTRLLPQCAACLRSYAWATPAETTHSRPTALRQQVRGKKKMTKTAGSLPVRLLRDVPGFGKRGAIVPVTAGEMRNKFFPRRFADYMTPPELQRLRTTNIPIERDYGFGKERQRANAALVSGGIPGSSSKDADLLNTFRPTKTEIESEKLSPDRSMELLEIFVKPVLEFYRQPIMEEKEPEPNEGIRTASSAAADLLAARSQQPKTSRTQAIYGSVSLHDVLVHVKAAMATNDESARVILTENDIQFSAPDSRTEGKVKHVGNFPIEISIKGADAKLMRTIRVIPQEA